MVLLIIVIIKALRNLINSVFRTNDVPLFLGVKIMFSIRATQRVYARLLKLIFFFWFLNSCNSASRALCSIRKLRLILSQLS